MLLSTVIYFRIYSEGLADWKVKTLYGYKKMLFHFEFQYPVKWLFPCFGRPKQQWRLVVKMAGRAAKFNLWLNI